MKVRHIKMSLSKEDLWHAILPQNPATCEMTGVNADGKLLTIDLDKETATPLMPTQVKPIRNASWSPDGTRLVTIDEQKSGGTIAVWDVRAGKVIATIPEKNAYLAASHRTEIGSLRRRESSRVISVGWLHAHMEREIG